MKHSTLLLNPSRKYIRVKQGIYKLVEQLENLPVYDLTKPVITKDGDLQYTFTEEMLMQFNGRHKVTVVEEEEIWYDTRKEFDHKVGDVFLIGKVVEVLSYEKYIAKFPNAKEMFEEVNEDTGHKGYIRTYLYDKQRRRPYEMWYEPKVMYSINVKENSLATLVELN